VPARPARSSVQSPGAGAVYVFTRTGTTWTRQATLNDPAAAAWTGFTLRHDLFQHPKLVRNTYRTTPWALRSGQFGSLRVSMERALHSTLVNIEGVLDRASAKRLAI